MTLIGIACALIGAFIVAMGGGGISRALVASLSALVCGSVAILAYAMFTTSTQAYADAVAALGDQFARQILDATTWAAFKAVIGVSIVAGIATFRRQQA